MIENNSLTVKKFAEVCGVSARTIKYYEEMGLLLPKEVLENGYRIYDMAQVDKVSTILLLKEYGFSLKHIKSLLTEENLQVQYKNLTLQKQIVQQQKERLEEKEERLNETLFELEQYFHYGNQPFLAILPEIRIEPQRAGNELLITNSLLDGMKSGIMIDPVKKEINGIYRLEADGSIVLSGKAVCMYHEHPGEWKEAVDLLLDYAKEKHVRVSSVYIETILETGTADTCFIKLFAV